MINKYFRFSFISDIMMCLFSCIDKQKCQCLESTKLYFSQSTLLTQCGYSLEICIRADLFFTFFSKSFRLNADLKPNHVLTTLRIFPEKHSTLTVLIYIYLLSTPNMACSFICKFLCVYFCIFV